MLHMISSFEHFEYSTYVDNYAMTTGLLSVRFLTVIKNLFSEDWYYTKRSRITAFNRFTILNFSTMATDF